MQETNPTEIICIQQNAETPDFKLLLINDCGLSFETITCSLSNTI